MIERPRLGWEAIGREHVSRAVTQYRLIRLHFQYKGDLVDRGAEVAEAHILPGAGDSSTRVMAYRCR